MRVKSARVVLAPTQGYICLSCRLQSAGVSIGNARRYKHTNKKSASEEPRRLGEGVKNDTGRKSKPLSTISNLIKGFISNDAKAEGTSGDREETKVDRPDGLLQQKHEAANDGVQATQRALQQKFADTRRKQKLQMQIAQSPDGPGQAVPAAKNPVTSPSSDSANSLWPKASRLRRRARRATEQLAAQRRSKKAEAAREAAAKWKKADTAREDARRLQQAIDEREGEKLSASPHSRPVIENTNDEEPAKVGLSTTEKDATEDHSQSGSLNEDAAQGTLPTALEHPPREVKPSKYGGNLPRKVSSKVPSDKGRGVEVHESVEDGTKRLSEAERKADLVRKLSLKIVKHVAKEPPETAGQTPKSPNEAVVAFAKRSVEQEKKLASKSTTSGKKLSDVAGFDSLQGTLGGKLKKANSPIERADATKLEILPLEVPQPPVPSLSYGLERVLFNPGVYQLQDPRSRVFNFDPYLQKIMPVAEFDFNALKEYITSSRDESLNNIAQKYGKRYMGSTSSMTGVLSHFHFLLSQWRPINTSMLSKEFPTALKSFTELQRTPQAIFLRWKDGAYAIDADKEFASANVLSMLGKSMEKLLTLSTEDYEKYRKSSGDEVADEDTLAPESYHYSTMGDFLMRSQLDAHDPRLPGTGMFDLKTRAVVSIRMDVTHYEHGLGYQIRSRQGEWESYEREYYDMIRAAFLKYSMQVRMGRMDGIFVAFHNIERIFGFQYISLPEMDSTIHGQWDTSLGDQEFKLSLDLLNKILDRATKKFPETSLRIHFETRDAATPFMYIFAEPVTEEQVAEIQSHNDAKIQEFERSILGPRRGEDSDTQDDDGKWENIQASVQEAMDKDEKSVDDPNRNQDSQGEKVESDQSYDSQGVHEEGPLYTNKNRLRPEDDIDPVPTAEQGDGIEGEEDVEIEGSAEENNDEQLEDEGEDMEISENRVESLNAGEDAALMDKQQPEDAEEAVEEDSAVLQDPADELEPTDEDNSELSNNNTEVEQTSKPDDLQETDTAESEEQPKPEPTQEPQNPSPTSKKPSPKAEKAAYTPSIPGSPTSPKDSTAQTQADGPFLDAIHEEAATLSAKTPSLLAMTLTLRNKVNDEFVQRPENLSADDVWSIEYTLVDVPDEGRARALYEACQVRRRKKLDAGLVPEEEEVISSYLMNLRKMSLRGKEWRREMDERDRRGPVMVLGRERVGKGEEGKGGD